MRFNSRECNFFGRYTPPALRRGRRYNTAAAIVRRNSAVPVIFGREADKARAETSGFSAALHHKFSREFSVKS